MQCCCRNLICVVLHILCLRKTDDFFVFQTSRRKKNRPIGENSPNLVTLVLTSIGVLKLPSTRKTPPFKKISWKGELFKERLSIKVLDFGVRSWLCSKKVCLDCRFEEPRLQRKLYKLSNWICWQKNPNLMNKHECIYLQRRGVLVKKPAQSGAQSWWPDEFVKKWVCEKTSLWPNFLASCEIFKKSLKENNHQIGKKFAQSGHLEPNKVWTEMLLENNKNAPKSPNIRKALLNKKVK
jgi:hypothetical protein